MQIEIFGLEQINQSQQKSVAKIIKRVLKGADLNDYSINISMVDNKTMKNLNHRFKSKNSITDVLSFPLPDMERQFEHTKSILGDVVICLPKASAQARECGHSLEEEIAVLVAHGLFHLLGYDHEVSEEDAHIQMQGEMHLLDRAGLPPQLSLIGRA